MPAASLADARDGARDPRLYSKTREIYRLLKSSLQSRPSTTQIAHDPHLERFRQFRSVRLLNVVPALLPAEPGPLMPGLAVEQHDELARPLGLCDRVVACICVEDGARERLRIGRGARKVVEARAPLRL